MTTEEQKAVDEKCDEFCEYRRTHSNGYPPREWFMAGVKALDDLRNLSEPKTKVGEPSEELVEKITNILKSNERLENVWLAPKWATVPIIDHSQFEKVATEIAKLLQPDVNAELLSALKETDKDLCVLESTMLQIEQRDHLAEGMTELVKSWRKRNKQAISNYEKQQ